MVYFFSRFQLVVLLGIYLYLGTVKISTEVAASFNDLIAHGVGYLILMCSGFFAFPERSSTLRLFIAFLVFSFLIECIQYFLPYRSFSLLDMLANGSGLLAGIGVGWLLLPIFIRLHQAFDTGN